MINDWKLGMKMLRYAYNLKMTIIAGAFLLAVSALGIVLGAGTDSDLLGNWLFLCIGLLPTQLLYSLSVPGMVQTSPAKKRMQTSVPAVMTFANMAILYLVEIAIQGVIAWGHPERMEQAGNGLITLAVMMVIIMLYLGVAYKYFIISTIVLFPVMYSWIIYATMARNGVWKFLGMDSIPIVLAVPVSLVLLMLGGFAQYLLSRLFYKAPLSKLAQSAPLRKEL